LKLNNVNVQRHKL
jgi:hypothetical protein